MIDKQICLLIYLSVLYELIMLGDVIISKSPTWNLFIGNHLIVVFCCYLFLQKRRKDK